MLQPQHINVVEMRKLLSEAYSLDPEKSVLGQVARRLRDPAMPHDTNGRSRAHPLWLALGLIASFVVAVFLYFSFLRS